MICCLGLKLLKLRDTFGWVPHLCPPGFPLPPRPRWSRPWPSCWAAPRRRCSSSTAATRSGGPTLPPTLAPPSAPSSPPSLAPDGSCAPLPDAPRSRFWPCVARFDALAPLPHLVTSSQRFTTPIQAPRKVVNAICCNFPCSPLIFYHWFCSHHVKMMIDKHNLVAIFSFLGGFRPIFSFFCILQVRRKVKKWDKYFFWNNLWWSWYDFIAQWKVPIKLNTERLALQPVWSNFVFFGVFPFSQTQKMHHFLDSPKCKRKASQNSSDEQPLSASHQSGFNLRRGCIVFVLNDPNIRIFIIFVATVLDAIQGNDLVFLEHQQNNSHFGLISGFLFGCPRGGRMGIPNTPGCGWQVRVGKFLKRKKKFKMV